jgi:hypothetical protein
MNELSYNNFTWFHRRNVAEARVTILMDKMKYNRSTAPELSDITDIDNIAVCLLSIVLYGRNLIAFYQNPLILMCCLTLWLPTNNFAGKIETVLN